MASSGAKGGLTTLRRRKPREVLISGCTYHGRTYYGYTDMALLTMACTASPEKYCISGRCLCASAKP